MFLGHSLETQWMVMELALQKNDQVLFDDSQKQFQKVSGDGLGLYF